MCIKIPYNDPRTVPEGTCVLYTLFNLCVCVYSSCPQFVQCSVWLVSSSPSVWRPLLLPSLEHSLASGLPSFPNPLSLRFVSDSHYPSLVSTIFTKESWNEAITTTLSLANLY